MKKLLAFLAVPIIATVILIGCVALPDLGVIEPQQVAGRTLSVAGLTTLNGGLVMDSPAFSVADGTGNTVISGTLTISDTATLVGAVAVDSATVGGGYGATGCSISAAGVVQCNGAVTTDGALTAGSTVIGGGYGSTGATISSAGVGQFNGALTTDGLLTADGGVAIDTSAFTVADATGNTVVSGTLTVSDTVTLVSSVAADSATVGGGYGSTGCSISAAGVLQCNGAATTDGALTADSAAIGGGYGATGATVSNAGVGQFNGALTTDGALTAASAAIGGGYGDTGATISAAGVGQFNGALTTDGLLTANGGIAVDTSAFTVADATGNTVISGTLTVSNTTTLVSSVAAASATVGGGYGDTGCTVSAAGVLQCNGAATTDGALTADSAVVGGGYGSTGATISTAGVGQFNGALTTDGALTADSTVVGGGYGATGATISTAGVGQFNGALTIDGSAALNGGITVDTSNFTVDGTSGAIVTASSLTADSAALGGGYGATGCSISAAGVLQCNGAATTDGALTADSAVVGGGYGSTGATISTAGVGQFNGALTTDGALTADSVVAGGGYGSTGCTLSTAGVLQCNGAATTDGALTADSAVIGGGYGSTGATLSAAGVGQFNGALTTDGLLTADGGIAVDTANFTVDGSTGAVSSKGDITTAANATGGNAGAKNEFIGLPRIKLVSLGTGTGPAGQTIALVDDSPTGEYAPVDADVTEAEGSVDGIYKYGASSYKAAFADTAAENDGFIDAGLGASTSWEDMESIGLLVYVTTTLTSGDLQLAITDDGAVRKFNIPAVATANTWTWVEVDISSLAAGTGDVITDFAVTLTAQGATNLAAFTIYVDIAYVWDAADEEALGTAIQQDGVLSVVSVATAGGSANTTSDLVELTDYLVHYESGNDFIVWITSQSATSNLALIAY